MKKLNLFNRLFTDSHEKQSPQRFVRYAAMLIMLLTLGVGQMWGTTVYVAIPSGTISNGYVDLNVNYKGDGDEWENVGHMTNTGYTYDGNVLYSGNVTEKYGGLGCIQFLLKNSSNVQTDYDQVFGTKSWTGSSTYSGKIHVWKGSGWNTYKIDYTATISAGSNGSVSPSGSGQKIKVSGTAVTATPDTHYAFVGWSASDGGISPTSSTNNPETFTATGNGGTITASFAPQWNIKGSGTEMGNWETYNALNYISSNTYRGTITLAANTVYEFKVVDRRTDAYYGYGSAKGDCSFVGQTTASPALSSADGKKDLRIATANAGTYTFEWNSSSKTLTVTYPNVSTVHPSTDYVYFKKPAGWEGVKAHVYTDDSPVSPWASNPTLSTCTFDGNTYYYAALGGKESIIFTKSSDQDTKTGDLDADDHVGEYYDKTLVTPAWADFKVTITLNNQSATSAGTTSVNPVYKTEVLSTITPPEKDDYTFDGYYTAVSGGGSKVINKSGAWLEVSGYTDASKHWIRKSSETLYANWTQEPGVTLTASKTSGINVGETITLTATPSQAPSITKYEFYLSDNTKIGEVTAPTNTFSYTPTTVGDKTVYVKMYYNSTTLNSDNLELSLNTPSVALAVKAGSSSEIYLDETTTIMKATPSNVGAGVTPTYVFTDQAASPVSSSSQESTEWEYTPGVTGTKTMKVTMTVGGSTYTATATVYVYEHWNIYVQNNCNWASGVALYQFGDAGTNADWPGVSGASTACEPYGVKNWYKVTLNSKYTSFILDNNQASSGIEQSNNCATGSSSDTYAANTYWTFAYDKATTDSKSDGKKYYNLVESTLSAPTVTLAYEVISCTQIKVTGTITGYGGYGSSATDLEAVGFQLDSETPVAAGSTDGSTFTKYFTGLTAGTEYSIKAYATNIKAKGESSASAITTRASGSYTIHVRIPKGNDAPYLYGYTDETSNGGAKEENDEWPGEAMTLDKTGTVYKWYSKSLGATYNHLIVSEGDVDTKTFDFDSPGSETCYWYVSSNTNADEEHKRMGSMACPSFDPQLMIEETQGGDFDYLDMSGSGPYTKTVSLAAKSTYKFKPIYNGEWLGKYGASLTRGTNSATGLAADDETNLEMTTDVAGDYTFTFTSPNTIAITYPTAYTVTFGQKSIYDPNVTNTSDASTTGGSVTAEDNSSNTVLSGDYVIAAANVTFTAHPATGYAFDGWYSDAACTLANKYYDNSSTLNTIVIDNEAMTLTLNNIGAAKTVYAKYVEIMTSVHVTTYEKGTFKIDDGSAISETVSPYVQVGVHTTHKVTIVSEADGYYFAGWKLEPAISCEEEDKAVNFTISGTAADEDNRTNVTITGLGDPTKCTTLNFLKPDYKTLDHIYFRNVFDDGTNPATHWENVYVFFDVSQDGENDNRAKTSNNDSYADFHVAMTPIGYNTGIYGANVPRWITRNNKYKVAFASYDQDSKNYTFWPGSGDANHGSAVYRDDYRSYNNLFVPYHVASTGMSNKGNTDYYNDGYWRRYPLSVGDSAGYYLERRTGNNTYSGRNGTFEALSTKISETKVQYRLRIDGMNKDKYVIFNEAGKKYRLAGGTKDEVSITHDNCTNREMIEDNDNDEYFILTPTAEGEYVLTLDWSGDRMKLSVEYPVVAGDYVIENAYTDASGSKTTRSNIIKASSAGTKTRYSMYLNNAGSGTLKLRKCNSINLSGQPVWSDGDDTNLQEILNDAKFTKGVYQFDITIANDKVSEVDSLRLYTGNFYIKTDAAPGGWVGYKSNVLEKNTVNFDRTSATYDHYMCKYFESRDNNIKSVIANDYCNQLSDTVRGDGIARMVDGEPYVPVDETSIRFSYNSATNETKRAYLGASLDNEYMNIMPYESGKIYNTAATPVDLFDTEASQRRFSDLGNWVYEINLKVKPGGKAGVQSAFTDATPTKHYQTLIPSDNVVLDGSSSNLYTIRVVYDFKTNYMMSAFVLTDDPINEDLHDFDMLWIRHKDDAATQLNLGDGKKLENVRVVGAIELRYDSMHYNASHTGHWTDLSRWDSDSRPYLKYFVSFPFDVHVNSIFGLNQAKLGTDYIIQGYNGEKRAKEGLFYGDGDSYWEYLTKDSIMHAGQGYYVIFDNDYARGAFGHIWDNKGAGSRVYMYFPAMKEIAKIVNTDTTSTVAAHTCTINRAWSNNANKNHMKTDSHWNTMGSPLFHNSYIKAFTNGADTALSAYYYLDNPSYGTSPEWKSQAIKDAPMFKAMSAVLVQWCGTIKWTTTETAFPAASSAPRRTAEDEKKYFVKLDMLYNGELRDWTYLDLREGADADFMLNEDMSKVNNRGVPNIYTFAGAYDVAYNTLPVENQTIPVGMIASKAGTYTFSMPYNFSGTVTLIDKYAQTRTNLALDDYEVYLNKGTIDDRFELEINIHKAPTAIDGVEDGSGTLKDGKAHKFIENDQMYILMNGVMYDARGNRVQ